MPRTAACSCYWSRTRARRACPAALPNSRTAATLLTLRRETREEAAAEVGEPLFIGHLSSPDETRSRLRYAAALTCLGPAPVDPATGRTYLRILATPEQALELFDWGEPAADQLAALHQARTRLGIPKAVRQPVSEPALDTFAL